MIAARTPRPVLAVLLSVAGLAVWAAHFTAIYAIGAVACERRFEDARLLGLPWIAAMVAIATIIAFALIVLVLHPACRVLRRSPADGGGTEPGFTRWLAGATAVLAALGIAFQALPVVLLPGCG